MLLVSPGTGRWTSSFSRKAMSIFPLISKAMGQKLEMTDLNISDTEVERSSAAQFRIPIILPWYGFWYHLNTVSLFCGIGPLRAKRELLGYWIGWKTEFGKACTRHFWVMQSKTKSKTRHTQSRTDVWCQDRRSIWNGMFYETVRWTNEIHVVLI